LRGEWILRAATATDERAGGRVDERGRVDGQRHFEAFLSSFPAPVRRDGIGTCHTRPHFRVVRGGCRGFNGPFPLPLWMRYSVLRKYTDAFQTRKEGPPSNALRGTGDPS